MKRTMARGLAAAVLAGVALTSAGTAAQADTIVKTGSSGWNYYYVNVNTGFRFSSSTDLGDRFETSPGADCPPPVAK